MENMVVIDDDDDWYGFLGDWYGMCNDTCPYNQEFGAHVKDFCVL
jgi:hypothetical protein